MRCLTLFVAVSLTAGALHAQQTSEPPLREYVGTYTYGPGRSLEIVAGDVLFAVLDDAKYKLRRVGGDTFVNGVGDTIPFRRNAKGVVTGFEERGARHARISPRVRAQSAALAWPRRVQVGAATPYHYRAPARRADGIAVGDIAASDLDSTTAARIVNGVLDGTYADVHGVLLFQRGALVLEEYFYGYDATRTHQLRSATKSFVSALAGIAVDRGAVANAEVPVLAAMPYAQYTHPDPRKAAMTLGQLLSMRSGLACNDYDGTSPGRETEIYTTPDWVKATLDLPMATDPGQVAHYCSGGVAVVGRMVERAVHRPLPAFAQQYLFAPLGIPRTHWSWNYTLTNTNTEFSQLHVRPRDLLKFGLLFANGGTWHGTRIISEEWVRASLAEQTQLDGTGYGYFWWRPYLNVSTPQGVQRVYVNAAQGNGGQKIYIIPALDLVAVFLGGDYNSGGSPPNKIMAGVILPRLLETRRAH